MIPFIRNSRKCKLIYKDQQVLGGMMAGGRVKKNPGNFGGGWWKCLQGHGFVGICMPRLIELYTLNRYSFSTLPFTSIKLGRIFKNKKECSWDLKKRKRDRLTLGRSRWLRVERREQRRPHKKLSEEVAEEKPSEHSQVRVGLADGVPGARIHCHWVSVQTLKWLPHAHV